MAEDNRDTARQAWEESQRNSEKTDQVISEADYWLTQIRKRREENHWRDRIQAAFTTGAA